MNARTIAVGLSFLALGATIPSGSTRWRTEIDGGANRDDHALAVAIDANGDAVTAGDLVRTGDLATFAVAKIDGATGSVVWEAALDGTGDSFDSGAEAVAVDTTGDVYAAGAMDMQVTSTDFAVAKLRGTDGAELWRVTLNAGFSATDQANDVAVDASGDVVAGGFATRSGIQRFTVVKLDGATGSVVWRRELSDDLPFRTQANAVAVDAQGDVVAAGSIAHGGRAEDFAVVKLDGDTGQVVWRQEVDGTGHYQDEAYDLVFDSQGSILVSGFIFGAQTVQDFAVLKLDGDTGRRRWQWMRGGEATATAWGVAVDSTDNVVAVGEIQRPGTKTEFTVILLSGTTGRAIRQVLLDGTDHWFDVAFDVAVSQAGAVIAAGWFINQGTGADLAVVRLR